MTSERQNLFAQIPPAQAMEIKVSNVWKNGIELSAPFECNSNDKGTAFAGSIASLLTLAGWSLLTLQLREQSLEPDIMVVASQIKYARPATQALRASVEISQAELERIQNELQTRQRSRARLCIALHSGETECATATAEYALILKS
jgi:thioesterase domain-containing protein